ncbi:MAG TPA: hypothetical protein VMO00_13725, partial [Methylomirabilota bacterium]|nr:hypothetical protein [Methylomirabilota bacterium]
TEGSLLTHGSPSAAEFGMKRYLRIATLCFACALLLYGCSHREENSQEAPKSKVKEAVKDAVTQDFKLYQGAKDSLKESEEKHNSELEQIDKESK